MKTLIIFFLLPLQIIAQPAYLPEKNIEGVWIGFLYTTGAKLPYELAISQNQDILNGYSLTVFTFDGKENIGVKKIKLKNKKGIISLEDGELIYDNYTTPPRRVKLFSTFSLNIKDSAMILSGTFFTKSMDYRSPNQNSYEGIIRLQKQTIFNQTNLITKLDEMNLLNTLSFIQPAIEEKNVTAIVQVPVEKINPPQAKEKEKEIILSPLIVKQLPPVIVPPPKEEIKTTVRTSTEKQEATVLPKDKETAIITKPVTEKKIVRGADPKQKEVLDNAPAIAILKSRPVPVPKDNEIAVVRKPVIEKKLPPVPEPEKKAVVTTTPIPFKKTMQPAIPTNTAADVDTRKTEIIRSVFFKTDSLVINLYDNGEIDGDTVSVVLNGKIIIAKEGLTTKAITKTIYITPDLGDSLQLVMYAENLGTLPPNTGLLTIQDGAERYEIRFAGDFTKNSAIILRRRE
jgi:hypothetical protein